MIDIEFLAFGFNFVPIARWWKRPDRVLTNTRYIRKMIRLMHGVEPGTAAVLVVGDEEPPTNKVASMPCK